MRARHDGRSRLPDNRHRGDGSRRHHHDMGADAMAAEWRVKLGQWQATTRPTTEPTAVQL